MVDRVLCIDGGGTKTAIATCTKFGLVQDFPDAQGCNPQDNPNWAQNLRQAIQIANPPFSYAIIGMPGYGEIPKFDTEITKVIQGALGRGITILNDVELAYNAAFPSGNGLLLLAGTGSMAMARMQGKLWRVGGWGDLIGDEGSAFWIGSKVLTHLSHITDGRATNDKFGAQIATYMDVSLQPDNTSLLAWVQALPHARSGIANLAKKVDTLAENGDRTAQNLLQASAHELTAMVTALRRRTTMPQDTQWAFAGSVFKSKTVLKEVTHSLGRPPVKPAFQTLESGLLSAAEMAGWPQSTERNASLKSFFSKETE